MTITCLRACRPALFQPSRYGLHGLLCLALVLSLLSLSGCGKSTISPSPGLATGQGITNTAKKNIGVRYKLGGTKPSTGFDCSGLVCWTYEQHGIKVPRTTTEQMKAGKGVSRDQLRPGDIVVFKTSNSPRGLHTGIYTGNGKFIHSPSSGKTVREDAINSSYWKPRFVTARRMPQVR